MMNPYEVLGLAPGAGDAQVKAAYKEKARLFANDPTQMREIDRAYDEIVMNQMGGGYSQPNDSYAQSGVSLGEVRAKINAGRIDEADSLLENMPVTLRSAEWYYLKGTVQHRKGWLEDAAQNFDRAAQMEPNNAEFRRASETVRQNRSAGYRTEDPSKKNDGCLHCSACDMCSGLLCADCCCECMGGDLIPCC